MFAGALCLGSAGPDGGPTRKGASPVVVAQRTATVTSQPVPLGTQDDARKVADAYLLALTEQGDDHGRDALLGGATLNARLESLSNAKVVAREPLQVEQGELEDVTRHMEAMDMEGRRALARVMGGGPGGGPDPEGLDVAVLSGLQADRLLAPTREKAAQFKQCHPVFAALARVDKELYWHPKNPVRRLLVETGSTGKYQLEFHLFRVETVEGREKTARVWPLRVVRLRTSRVDTGWRVVPASDWNAE